eukprot:Transcript_19620.p2 GENE.Transcript_19620~~Transcript_19620.p2  ORF type:complete len:192 (-),score=3.90 Transcript_19620:63-638(-)
MSAPIVNDKRTLYVGGLEESVTQEILQAAFLPFGEITDVNLPLDNASQKHRGFAFVQFEDRGDAADAIDNMNNAELFGRVLKVNIAKPSASVGGHRPGELCSCPCTCSHLLSRWWSLRQSGSRKPTPTTRTSRRAGTTPRARQGPHDSGRGSLVHASGVLRAHTYRQTHMTLSTHAGRAASDNTALMRERS